MSIEERPVKVGDLAGIVTVPEGPVRAGLVLSDGSGPATKDAWQVVPQWLAGRGVATLRHDKPATWRAQSFADRAAEALTALAVLRREAAVERAGVIGYSQGGWVALAAAVTAPDRVGFVVTVSGPAVTPAEQERVRMERAMRAAGLPPEDIEAGLRWADERAERVRSGTEPAAVLREQAALPAAPWHPFVTGAPYDTAEDLAFVARNLAFDPSDLLPFLPCPILAIFGGADELVPVERSVAVLGERLSGRHRGRNGLIVVPGAGHMPPPERFLPVLGEFIDLMSA
ncbi:alpha/beta hydrolase [Dactylosporangium sp. AC04546]|uniref:alpha/beta hydrolase family protein n=1 Tax=Dactylosporangium sp. AC04546 TaxID=2862460 RepID=UPI001EDEEEA4|nr:alpha/beta hydrolase [Dactylosporangium sp. AC04546]WVK81719.1 alpha/beta hydrolase [Dactylosporangium sp. AC04546]